MREARGMQIYARFKGAKTTLTRNFISTEFDCRCTDPDCKHTILAAGLVKRLQAMRDELGQIIINRGYSCAAHNAAVGGKPHSLHLLGMAADISPGTADMDTFRKAALRHFSDGGVGVYESHIHVDLRGVQARW